MGRKPITKNRKENPEIRKKWAAEITPIFIKNGLKKFSMDEVAKLLNVSKATLYKHFASRELLLSFALEEKLQQIGNFQNDLFNETLPFLDRYHAAIHIFFHEIAGISTEFLSDLKHAHPKLWKKITFFIKFAAELLKQFYQKGIEQGYFNNIEPAVLVLSDKVFFETISDPDFLKENNLTLQKAFKSYFELRINGLFTNTEYRTKMFKKIMDI